MPDRSLFLLRSEDEEITEVESVRFGSRVTVFSFVFFHFTYYFFWTLHPVIQHLCDGKI
jgi:hypothetical protein